MTGMSAIALLGDRLERAFRDANYDERAFPELATRALSDGAPHREFSIADLVQWAHSAAQIPSQPESDFGEPAVMLYCGRRFYLEALFWLDGTPTIHQHGFSGAFQVLEGSSIHTRFRFSAERSVNQSLVLGALELGRPELLRKGDTRSIWAADRLIHSTFHLDRPSVTLVARTYRDAAAAPQLRYLRSGVALSSVHDDSRLRRLLELFEMVFRAKLPDRVQIVVEFLETSDLHSSILVLERLCFAERSELMALAEVVARRHVYAATWVRDTVDCVRRETLIVQRRSRVSAPAHRFLLALLLNVESRDEVLRLIGEAVRDRDPGDQLVEWIGEMCSAGADGTDDGGLDYALGPVELRVLRELLRGSTVDEIVAAFSVEYDDGAAQAPAVRALCAALQKAALFRSILRGPDLRAVADSRRTA